MQQKEKKDGKQKSQDEKIRGVVEEVQIPPPQPLDCLSSVSSEDWSCGSTRASELRGLSAGRKSSREDEGENCL